MSCCRRHFCSQNIVDLYRVVMSCCRINVFHFVMCDAPGITGFSIYMEVTLMDNFSVIPRTDSHDSCPPVHVEPVKALCYDSRS